MAVHGGVRVGVLQQSVSLADELVFRVRSWGFGLIEGFLLLLAGELPALSGVDASEFFGFEESDEVIDVCSLGGVVA